MSPALCIIWVIAELAYIPDNLLLSLRDKIGAYRQIIMILVSRCRIIKVHECPQHVEIVSPTGRPGCLQLNDFAALTPPHRANAQRQEPH
jgi:hypothetical protein